MGSRWMRNTFIYLLIVVAVVAIVWSFLGNKPSNTQPKDISDVVALVQSGQVESIDVSGDNLTVHVKNDSTVYKARKEGGVSIYEILNNAGVSDAQIQAAHIKVASPSKLGSWLPFLFNLVPFILLGGILIFILRQAQGSNSQAMSFGKSRARMFSGQQADGDVLGRRRRG